MKSRRSVLPLFPVTDLSAYLHELEAERRQIALTRMRFRAAMLLFGPCHPATQRALELHIKTLDRAASRALRTAA